MRFYVTLKDLKPEALREIRAILKAVMAPEIEEAGTDRDAVEAESIDEYLEGHNFRIPVDL